MDAGVRDPSSGDIMVMSREDDVINVAGHRLSTSAIEEVVLSNPDVVDAAVVGVPDSVKGQLPLVLYIASHSTAKEGLKIISVLLIGELWRIRPMIFRKRNGSGACGNGS